MMADRLEKMADAMAPAKGAGAKGVAAKGAAAKTMGAKTVAAKAAAAKTAGAGIAKTGIAKTGAATAGVSAKAGATTVASVCTKGFGIGLGLGPLGPVLAVAGGATVGWYVYKKYFNKNDIDAPSI